jgi:uncharacterized protein
MSYLAFRGSELLSRGDLATVAQAIRSATSAEPILVLDAQTSHQVEIDFRSDPVAPTARLCTLRPVSTAPPPPRPPNRPGRPRALRKLIDEARRTHAAADARRAAQDSAYRFLTTLAGNLPGYEEALRALFAQDAAAFTHHTEPWPLALRDHARHLARLASPQQQIAGQ